MSTKTEIHVRLSRPYPAQRQVIREATRFNVLDCGRRWGKSTLGIDRLVVPALEGYPVAWFSPTYSMLTEIWRDVRRDLLPVTVRSNAQERRIELLTGGTIDMWSLDTPDIARGRKYKRVIVDEAAMIRELQHAWQAVLRPTLTDYEGDAWFLSTPKGLNFFKTMYDWGLDPAMGDWRAWHFPTASNPFISADEIEKARLELPERIFQQEYLAVFLEFEGAVFRRVLEAATATAQERALPGHQYVFGCDWGKVADFTVISVVDVTTRELVALDRFNQIDYIVQLGRLEALFDRFHPTAIIAEQNSIGVPIIEQLVRRGWPVQPFQTTNATKAVAIDALALAFEQGALRILTHPVLLAELQAYEAERLPSGLLRYGAPEGMHDDCVMSLALAWQAASVPPPSGVSEDRVPAFGRERRTFWR